MVERLTAATIAASASACVPSANSDIVFAGVEEAELTRSGPAETIIKDGARGCSAWIDGTAYELDALPVTVVDPVGAGDAFVAGYLADRLAGREPHERLKTAIAAGAFAVTVPGDCEGLPRRADLGLITQDDNVAR